MGILNPAALVPQIDTSILVGFPAAQSYLGFDGHPTELYVRTVNTQAATTTVDNLLAAQANPAIRAARLSPTQALWTL